MYCMKHACVVPEYMISYENAALSCRELSAIPHELSSVPGGCICVYTYHLQQFCVHCIPVPSLRYLRRFDMIPYSKPFTQIHLVNYCCRSLDNGGGTTAVSARSRVIQDTAVGKISPMRGLSEN